MPDDEIKKFWIVVGFGPNWGQNSYEKKFNRECDATSQAEKLARQNIETDFVVMEAILVAKAQTVTQVNISLLNPYDQTGPGADRGSPPM